MISIVVVLFNMRREAVRTLYTLSPAYQKGVTEKDYEVLVVENGSREPLGETQVNNFGPNFRYIQVGAEACVSPVHVVNQIVARSRGTSVGILFDGARMVTPGLVSLARSALVLSPRAVVGTMSWHLGSEHQSVSSAKGYTQSVEDELLQRLNWREDGYRLFLSASWAYSNPSGHFGPWAESCATFLSRTFFEQLGGYEESFVVPGGGYANPDFFKRAVEANGTKVILLSGEGTFHQYHGGASTGPAALNYQEQAMAEYRSVRGKNFSPPIVTPNLWGPVSEPARIWLKKSLECCSSSPQEFFG